MHRGPRALCSRHMRQSIRTHTCTQAPIPGSDAHEYGSVPLFHTDQPPPSTRPPWTLSIPTDIGDTRRMHLAQVSSNVFDASVTPTAGGEVIMGSSSTSKVALHGSPTLEDDSTPAKCECTGTLHLPTRSQHFAAMHIAVFTPPCLLHKRINETSEWGDGCNRAGRPLSDAKH